MRGVGGDRGLETPRGESDLIRRAGRNAGQGNASHSLTSTESDFLLPQPSTPCLLSIDSIDPKIATMPYVGLKGNGLLAGITCTAGMGFILFGAYLTMSIEALAYYTALLRPQLAIFSPGPYAK